MKRLLVLVFLALSAPGFAGAHARTAQPTTPPSGTQFMWQASSA